MAAPQPSATYKFASNPIAAIRTAILRTIEERSDNARVTWAALCDSAGVDRSGSLTPAQFCKALKYGRPRGYSRTGRCGAAAGYSAETGRGGAAATTWIFRGGESRRRRGYDVDIPRSIAKKTNQTTSESKPPLDP